MSEDGCSLALEYSSERNKHSQGTAVHLKQSKIMIKKKERKSRAIVKEEKKNERIE